MKDGPDGMDPGRRPGHGHDWFSHSGHPGETQMRLSGEVSPSCALRWAVNTLRRRTNRTFEGRRAGVGPMGGTRRGQSRESGETRQVIWEAPFSSHSGSLLSFLLLLTCRLLMPVHSRAVLHPAWTNSRILSQSSIIAMVAEFLIGSQWIHGSPEQEVPRPQGAPASLNLEVPRTPYLPHHWGAPAAGTWKFVRIVRTS